MTTPILSWSVRSVLLFVGCAVVAISYSARPVLAADQPADARLLVSLDVEKGELITPKAARGAEADQHSMKSGNVTYTLTIHNNSKIPAKGLVVEYHFYNKTTHTDKGATTVKLDDITATEKVPDIDPGKTATITSKNVHYEDTQASNASMAGGRGAKTKVNPAATTLTEVLGWRVEARLKDQIIAHKDSATNLDDLLKPYAKSK